MKSVNYMYVTVGSSTWLHYDELYSIVCEDGQLRVYYTGTGGANRSPCEIIVQYPGMMIEERFKYHSKCLVTDEPNTEPYWVFLFEYDPNVPTDEMKLLDALVMDWGDKHE